MHSNIEERARRLAEYIVANNATVRAAAARYGVSKSTVHKKKGFKLVKKTLDKTGPDVIMQHKINR